MERRLLGLFERFFFDLRFLILERIFLTAISSIALRAGDPHLGLQRDRHLRLDLTRERTRDLTFLLRGLEFADFITE